MLQLATLLHYYTTLLHNCNNYYNYTTGFDMKSKRKQLGWSVPRESAEGFKDAVYAKWGKLRGVLGDELAQAMNNHVGNHMFHEHTHTKLAKISPESATYQRCLAVFDRLRGARGDRNFNRHEFETAIRTTLDVKDPRTIQGYIDQICELGWITFDYRQTSGYSIIRPPSRRGEGV